MHRGRSTRRPFHQVERKCLYWTNQLQGDQANFTSVLQKYSSACEVLFPKHIDTQTDGNGSQQLGIISTPNSCPEIPRPDRRSSAVPQQPHRTVQEVLPPHLGIQVLKPPLPTPGSKSSMPTLVCSSAASPHVGMASGNGPRPKQGSGHKHQTQACPQAVPSRESGKLWAAPTGQIPLDPTQCPPRDS